MKAIIVDDERLARQEMRKLLQHFPEIEIVGEAANVDDALDQIEKVKPEVLFLDIQMPEKTGFDLLDELVEVPQVIFTTAYDEFALKAFEVNAIDYLLKPVTLDRLRDALSKLNKPKSEEEDKGKMFQNNQVFIRDGEKCWFVKIDDIRLFESVGNYARVFFDNERPLIHRSLNQLGENLNPGLFFRANRQEIINLNFIQKIEPYFSGGLLVVMKDGRKVEVSRRQAARFKDMLST